MNTAKSILRKANSIRAFVVAGAFCFAPWSQAATIELSVAGYYGGNQSASGAVLPAGTTVELGIFYSGGVFTTSTAISSALAGVATTTQWSDFRISSGWVSFGSVTVGSGGDFEMYWSSSSSLNTRGPGLGSEFDLNPTTGALISKNLAGKNPYLWVQTADNLESGLFYSSQALPAEGFGASLQIDATTGTEGVTALRGAVSDAGLKTATLTPGTSSNSVVPTLRLLAPGTPSYVGGNTVITHTFAVNANGPYVIEYKSTLSDTWKTSNVTVSNSNNFSVTFTNPGTNSTSDWKDRMFFRAKNG